MNEDRAKRDPSLLGVWGVWALACVVVCVGIGMRGVCSGGVRGLCSGVGVGGRVGCVQAVGEGKIARRFIIRIPW